MLIDEAVAVGVVALLIQFLGSTWKKPFQVMLACIFITPKQNNINLTRSSVLTTYMWRCIGDINDDEEFNYLSIFKVQFSDELMLFFN